MALLDNYTSFKVNAYSTDLLSFLTTLQDALVARGFTLEYSSASLFTFRYQPSTKIPPVFFSFSISGRTLTAGSIGLYVNASGVVSRMTQSSKSITTSTSFPYLFVQVAEGFLSISSLSNSGWLGMTDDYQAYLDYLFPCNALFPDSNFLTTSTVLAGSNVFIPLDSNPIGLIHVGSYIFIMNSLGYLSRCLVSAVSSSGITVGTLALHMGAGSFVNYGYPYTSFTYSNMSVPPFILAAVGSSASYTYVVPATRYFVAPTSFGSLYVSSPVSLCTDADCFGVIYPDDNFIPFNTTRVSTDALPVNSDGSIVLGGTAASGTKSTIVDPTKSFAINELVGKVLYVFGGAGSGFFSRVASNTATEITLVDACPLAFSSTTVYLFCDKLYLFGQFCSIPNCGFLV